jgi:beta-glucosidase
VRPGDPSFVWGAATSAQQVEGDNTANDWADWEARPESGVAEAAGSACEHLARYPDDIALLAELGLNCYRFSVEWSRVAPAPGELSPEWLAHYRAMAQCCRAAGLVPAITLHHFTNPRWIAAGGGWEAPSTARHFAGYCGAVADALGDLAGLFITVNEPNMPALLGYENGVLPPGKRDRAARRRATDVFIEGHRAAIATLRERCPDVPCGLALAMADWQALPGGEAELSEVRHLREDVFLQATGGDDFVGVNTYTRHRIGPQGWVGNEPGVEVTAAGYEYWPWALEATLGRAWALTGRPLIVTETGVATDDDARRVHYIDEAVAGMRAARAAGADVRGFLYWSALDNYEWNHGYGQRFGLIAVDRATQRRSVKPSGWHLGKIARSSPGG